MRKLMLFRAHCASKWFVSQCLGALMVVAPGLAHSTPTITGVDTRGESIEQGARLTVHGVGFDSKSDSAPVLVDYVSEAYENGEKSMAYSGYEDGRVIHPASEDPESLWGATSSELPVRFDTDSNARHPFDGARYHLYGENVWLGRPVAYGGTGGWDTPENNKQLYLSWWLKVDYNSLYYWRFKPYEITDEFEPGESVLSKGELIGEYIGTDSEGLLNFIFPGHINSNDLKNIEITGNNSGAKTVFPEQFRAGDGYGYETPGSKTLRIWDDPKSRGIRTSLSHTDYYLNSATNMEYKSNRIYQIRDLTPGAWHHFEVELDVEAGTFKSWFNGELGGVAKFDPRAAYEEAYSPTIALIGNNGKQDHLQNMYISDIYFDKSVQRIIIGDSPQYEKLSHYELQRPIKWSDEAIEFSVNLGSLNTSSDLYVYVFDENGVPNQEGFELCASVDCPSPPETIQLQVE